MIDFKANDIFCCKQLHFHVYEKEKIIKYNPRIREFSIPVNSQVIQVIQYCPFCGTELPTELREIFFDTIRKHHNNPELSIGDLDSVDEEFKTDAWWRTRGL